MHSGDSNKCKSRDHVATRSRYRGLGIVGAALVAVPRTHAGRLCICRTGYIGNGGTGSGELQAPEIVFTLVNNAPTPVEIYESDLPWGIQASLSLTVFRLYATGTSGEVEPYYQIDDPGAGAVFVAPGAQFTGRVDLTERCAGIEGPKRTSDLLVKWYCVPMNADMVAGAPSWGWFVIPRLSGQ